MAMKDFYKVEVHAIDENVVCYFMEEESSKKSGMLSISVAEAEELIEFLNEAIAEAKKSKYYQE